jgi:phage baseplate assembly protein gpV
MSREMNIMRHAIRRDAESIAASLATPRFATVESVDPDNHALRLNIQPEGILTGWVPDGACFATGGGFGCVFPPSVGDQLVVVFPHGDADQPVVVGRTYSAVDRPPVSPATGKAVQPGEFAVFTDGAWIHITGGSIHAQATQFLFKGDMILDGNLTVTGDQNIEGTKDGSTGALRTKGEILDLAGSHGSLDDLRTVHNDHLHGGVQEGGADTSTPNLTK